MLKVEFTGNTADEMNAQVKDYVSKIKGTRNTKGEADEGAQIGAAPAPLMPPITGPALGGGFPGAPMTGFAPPAPGAAPATGFPAAGVTGPAPDVMAVVQRIVKVLDGAVASGQPEASARDWLAKQCGPEVAAWTLPQLKEHALPRLSVPQLEGIAKLMNA